MKRLFLIIFILSFSNNAFSANKENIIKNLKNY